MLDNSMIKKNDNNWCRFYTDLENRIFNDKLSEFFYSVNEFRKNENSAITKLEKSQYQFSIDLMDLYFYFLNHNQWPDYNRSYSGESRLLNYFLAEMKGDDLWILQSFAKEAPGISLVFNNYVCDYCIAVYKRLNQLHPQLGLQKRRIPDNFKINNLLVTLSRDW